jgi:hypothetical protein
VHSALLSGDPHDQLAIAYHLIVDNKRIADEAAKAELRGKHLIVVVIQPEPLSLLFIYLRNRL